MKLLHKFKPKYGEISPHGNQVQIEKSLYLKLHWSPFWYQWVPNGWRIKERYCFLFLFMVERTEGF